ncbi:MAG: cytidine deaminase [Candidatus Gastranaerophilales bacterium]|nr:cytidine deaminase [Candidatus Gastranaerophilales bacterium]
MDYNGLLKQAQDVSKNAYAKYSDFLVGACVLGSSGKIYPGCNVENASYGLTVCAERNAIANAVANGEKSILALAIYSPNMKDCTPCGACRQVISEFQGEKEVEVITQTQDGYKIYKISELLPNKFKL